jgi:hypothetical protein
MNRGISESENDNKKNISKKSPPKINDRLIESINSMCTPKQTAGL